MFRGNRLKCSVCCGLVAALPGSVIPPGLAACLKLASAGCVGESWNFRDQCFNPDGFRSFGESHPQCLGWRWHLVARVWRSRQYRVQSRSAHHPHGMRLQWFGMPGPRGMIDRGCRNPQPLSVNGVLFNEGLNRLSAQDAYNGRIYWSLEIPKLIRVNIPRDTSNTCADEGSLYVAVRDTCWRLNAYSGELTQYYKVQPPNPGTNHDWGYVACVTNRIYGSSVKRGAAYTEYSGPAYWYDSLGTESTAKVCSDNLFCVSKTNGLPLLDLYQWRDHQLDDHHRRGRIYFAESRNATAKSQATGRITSTALWQDLYLVALDAASGTPLWQQSLTNITVSPYPVVFFLLVHRGEAVARQFDEPVLSLRAERANRSRPLAKKPRVAPRQPRRPHVSPGHCRQHGVSRTFRLRHRDGEHRQERSAGTRGMQHDVGGCQHDSHRPTKLRQRGPLLRLSEQTIVARW